MVRAVVISHKADEQVVVALGGDGKGEGLGQSLAEIQASRPGSGSSFKPAPRLQIALREGL